MIIFYTYSARIVIPGDEYAVYNTYYLGDGEGNPIDKSNRIIGKNGEILGEAKESETYSYGDVIIQTPKCRYTFRALRNAAHIVQSINRFLDSQIGEGFIQVDLEKLSGGAIPFCDFITEKTPEYEI